MFTMQERLQCHCAVCFFGLSSLNIGRDPLRRQGSGVRGQRSEVRDQMKDGSCILLFALCSLRYANVYRPLATGFFDFEMRADDVKGGRT
jgi:hypothetical protein